MKPHHGSRTAAIAVALAAALGATLAPSSASAQEAAVATPIPDAALTPEELEKLVARIALYPDDLLSRVLMASTYPLEVVQAQRWLQQGQNAQLRGDALALTAGVLWGLTTLAIRTTRLATASAEKTLFYQIAVTALIAPVASLNADSLTTVWATRSRILTCRKIGTSVAGSVDARVEPSSNATINGTPRT